MKSSAVALLERGEIGHRHVAHVQHVARLVTVPIDGQRLAFDHPAREDGDDTSLFGEKVLAGAIDVGVAKSCEPQAEGPVKACEVLLEGELARSIRRQRPDRMILVRRDDVGFAV